MCFNIIIRSVQWNGVATMTSCHIARANMAREINHSECLHLRGHKGARRALEELALMAHQCQLDNLAAKMLHLPDTM